MKTQDTTTTRRQFLETAAAGTAGVAAATLATQKASAQNKGRADYKLFSEGRIGKLRVKNRLVRSAAFEAGAAFAAGDDKGKATEGYVQMLTTFAKGGVGTIITGYMSVMDDEFLPGQLGTFDDRYLPGLTKVAEEVRAVGNDCKLIAEIGHGGVGIGPSGYSWPTKQKGRILTTEEVAEFCTNMAEGTRRLKEAGFDGIEIHGAHHYVINAFLSPWSNRRTDRYGGSMPKRVEIVREMVAKMRDRVGPDFPILIKLNCDDGAEDDTIEGATDLDTFPALVKEIVATGVDAIDISGQRCPGDPLRMHLEKPGSQSFHLPYARALDVDVPVILGCGNKNVDRLEEIVQHDDKVAFVSFARPLFRQPDLPNQWLEGRGSADVDCISCNFCYNRIFRDGMSHCWQVGKPGLEQGNIVG